MPFTVTLRLRNTGNESITIRRIDIEPDLDDFNEAFSVGSPYDRPRLRLVHSRRRSFLPFGMHPALPSTLAFAALSMTALAFAALVDVANGIGSAAATVGRQLRLAR